MRRTARRATACPKFTSANRTAPPPKMKMDKDLCHETGGSTPQPATKVNSLKVTLCASSSQSWVMESSVSQCRTIARVCQCPLDQAVCCNEHQAVRWSGDQAVRWSGDQAVRSSGDGSTTPTACTPPAAPPVKHTRLSMRAGANLDASENNAIRAST